MWSPGTHSPQVNGPVPFGAVEIEAMVEDAE
jgi:hypothetical protein